MVPFCESWYRRTAAWFWILFVGGHPLFYAFFALSYYLVFYFPLDGVFAAGILGLASSFLVCTCLPFGYILVRTERKESLVAIMFQLICLLALVGAIASLSLAATQEMNKEGLRGKYISELRSESEDDNLIALPSWFQNFQRSYNCCGLTDERDYDPNGDLSFLRPLKHCNGDPTPKISNVGTTREGCLDIMLAKRETLFRWMTWMDVILLLGTVGGSLIHILSFWWVRKQYPVILTGTVYLRAGGDDLKAYPEIDSSEAVSLSSDDD